MWVKLDDRFTDHPKVARLSNAAFRAYVTSLCYAAGTLTDGQVPYAKARSWASVKVVGELLAANLWEGGTHGYLIHDYLDYQRSKAEILEGRQKDSERKRSGFPGGSGRIPWIGEVLESKSKEPSE